MEPIWLRVFRFANGLKEIPGATSNPVILNWNKAIGGPNWYDDDDKAWCAVGMNAALHFSGHPVTESADKFDLLRAKSFETYGVPLVIPAIGAIMVFVRPEGGHVGLYLGERKDAYLIYGANQSNMVGTAWIQKSRLVATRWPATAPLPLSERVWLNNVGEPVSSNEA